MGKSLREFVRDERDKEIASYGQVVREERFFCAVLFHLLISDQGFLEKFLEKCGVVKVELSEVRVFIEYAMARDLWNSMERQEEVNQNRAQFLKEWVPSLKEYVPRDFNSDSVREFNRRLVSGPPSEKYIQSPARWSEEKIKTLLISDKDKVKVACMLKWAFNIKPDIVIEYGNKRVVCIEAKVESPESKYSCNFKDNEGRKDTITGAQTEVQKFLMEKILGYETKSIFLSKNTYNKEGGVVSLIWKDVFEPVRDCNPMVKVAKKYFKCEESSKCP